MIALLFLAFIGLRVNALEFSSDYGLLDLDNSNGVETRLSLSPWELYVLTDLTLKITSGQCFKGNQNYIASFTKELSSFLQRAPKSKAQNEQFLPAYSRLTGCLAYLEEVHEGGKEIHETEKDVVQDEDKSLESDWAVNEAVSTSKPSKSEDKVDFTGVFQPVQNIFQWVIDSFVRRQLSPNSGDMDSNKRLKRDIVEAQQLKRDIEDAQQRKHQWTSKRARQNFANFFHEVSKVIQRVCPKIQRPNKNFIKDALLDVTTWVTLDQHDAIVLANRYLHKNNLLKKVVECNAARTK